MNQSNSIELDLFVDFTCVDSAVSFFQLKQAAAELGLSLFINWHPVLKSPQQQADLSAVFNLMPDVASPETERVCQFIAKVSSPEQKHKIAERVIEAIYIDKQIEFNLEYLRRLCDELDIDPAFLPSETSSEGYLALTLPMSFLHYQISHTPAVVVNSKSLITGRQSTQEYIRCFSAISA